MVSSAGTARYSGVKKFGAATAKQRWARVFHGGAGAVINVDLSGEAILEDRTEEVGIGIIAPFDLVLDREYWQWVPENVSVHITRTPTRELPMGAEFAVAVSDAELVAQFLTYRPSYLYAVRESRRYVVDCTRQHLMLWDGESNGPVREECLK